MHHNSQLTENQHITKQHVFNLLNPVDDAGTMWAKLEHVGDEKCLSQMWEAFS